MSEKQRETPAHPTLRRAPPGHAPAPTSKHLWMEERDRFRQQPRHITPPAVGLPYLHHLSRDASANSLLPHGDKAQPPKSRSEGGRDRSTEQQQVSNTPARQGGASEQIEHKEICRRSSIFFLTAAAAAAKNALEILTLDGIKRPFPQKEVSVDVSSGLSLQGLENLHCQKLSWHQYRRK